MGVWESLVIERPHAQSHLAALVPLVRMANDMFTFTMQIEGSVLHVTSCFAPVTAHKKPMLGDVLMMIAAGPDHAQHGIY